MLRRNRSTPRSRESRGWSRGSSRFRDGAEFAANQFYCAELLWSIAERTDKQGKATRWERAARAYSDVIANRSVEPKLAKEAAYAATLSWKNVVDFGEPEQQLLAAMVTYGGMIKDPRDEELATMAFMAGRIYLRYDHLDEAIARFAYLIDQHPAHELGPNAEVVLRSARLRRLKM